MPGRNSQLFQAKHSLAPKSPVEQNSTVPSRPRLEDLINELVALDTKTSTSSIDGKTTASMQKPPVPNTISHLPKSAQVKEFTTQTKKPIPPEIRKELGLPASSEAAYNELLSFYEANRHKPMLESQDGRIIYLEFDLEMQRIRLFTGRTSQRNCMFRNRLESAGYFVIEEVYELRVESHSREVLGFKRTEKKVLERFKNGSELLSASEASDKSIRPVLFFTIFNERLSGISSSCVKAEKVSK
jgi:hypothetical protein